MKLVLAAFAMVVASTVHAQFSLYTGPNAISAINGKIDGSAKHVWSQDRIGATLFWDEGSNDVWYGLDATFRLPVKGPETFRLVLVSAFKSDESAFDRFEVFDFTSRTWITVGATLDGPVSGNLATVFSSDELKRSRFVHAKTGEVWARTFFNAKYAPVVWIDQFAIFGGR